MTSLPEHKIPLNSLPRNCGSWSLWRFENHTLHIRPLSCHTWSCPRCAEMMRRRWGHFVTAAKPQRLGTITLLPKEREKTRRILQLIIRDLRKRGINFEYWGIIELTARGDPHMHFLQHGDYIPKHLFYARSKAHGSGYTDIRKVGSSFNAMRYVTKHLVSGHQRPAFRRRIRYSRKFFSPEIKEVMNAKENGWTIEKLPPKEALPRLIDRVDLLLDKDLWEVKVE